MNCLAGKKVHIPIRHLHKCSRQVCVTISKQTKNIQNKLKQKIHCKKYLRKNKFFSINANENNHFQ